jgi:hypothetical protein
VGTLLGVGLLGALIFVAYKKRDKISAALQSRNNQNHNHSNNNNNATPNQTEIGMKQACSQ